MGLFSQLITLPLAPVRGALWVTQQLTETAERQYYDPAPVRRELIALEQELVEGRISEQEFDRREDQLLDQLEELEAQQQRMAANGQPPG
ncbi:MULTISPECIES: gas vesicle protein GvpG [unclassified Streptomyces]|uniref:gas vesicle protein GvpG n=1 Tax=unclassified Streptomyces TaxID=2593676 RepID=UPI002E343B7D|nr:gas vesicle protein GvpG [Streptomyces sp. NBC_01460]WSS31435.1 gas vesicle protein GvpG [Streptomyces sp. NBC_01185]